MYKYFTLLAVFSLSLFAEANITTTSTYDTQQISITETTTVSSIAHASSMKMQKINKKAQRIFRKKLQKKCGFTISHLSQKHTTAEWSAIVYDDDLLRKEIYNICPKGKGVIKDEWLPYFRTFLSQFSSDSLTKPSC